MMNDIKNLEELLQSYIEPGSVLVAQKFTKLTAPGENYCSFIRALALKIKDSKGEDHTLNLVAKQIPDNEYLQKLFKIQLTFVKEMDMYTKIAPALVTFQEDQGADEVMNFFPKYFGGRLNMNPNSDIVDEDGVILLENLKITGFTTGDRHTGFNLQATEFILNNLAVIHAVPLALKLNKFEVFERDIAPHIKYVCLLDVEEHKEELESTYNRVKACAKELESECPNVVERVKIGYWSSCKTYKERYESIFNTISHNDFWVNNIMIKVVENEVVANKIIDFQVTEYSSAGRDIIFFLYSSVERSAVEKHYDELIKLYYDKFIDVLKKLKCDVSMFTFEAFEQELTLVAKRSEFCHCLLMARPILAPVTTLKELNELREEDMIKDECSEGEREKTIFIIKEFIKRQWI